MNTRKSSPLPNPNDTIARYQISYRIHYQNLHRHLLTRIYKEEAQKNHNIKEFNRLVKQYDKLKEKSYRSKTAKSEEQNQVYSKMNDLYNLICQKELQINKLYQQSEGILLQLCDMLKSSEEDMKKIRESNDNNHTQIKFLHNESLYQYGEEMDFAKSLDHDVTASSELGEENKSREIQLNQSNEKLLTRVDKLDMSCSFEKILKERLNRSKQVEESQQKISTTEKQLQKTRQIDINPLPIQEEEKYPENLINHRDDAREQLFEKQEKQTSDGLIRQVTKENSHDQNNETQNSVISKILNNYDKPIVKPETNNISQKSANQKEVIEINSSVEDCLGEKTNKAQADTHSELKLSKNLANQQQKNLKKQKKHLKSCITILD